MNKVLAFIFVGPPALFMYCWRHGTKLGWYRGCGLPPPKEKP
jgi:hypothetical protein